jgi:cytochrome P450
LVPFYAIHRNPAYFSPYTESFWPDRWLVPEGRKEINDLSKPLGKNVQVVLEHKAFAPFSSGPASCVGKTLAQNEMRIVASWVVQRFDMKPADGYNLDEWEDNLKDYYVMQKGGLPVVLTRRK